jgi:hypothetical protein
MDSSIATNAVSNSDGQIDIKRETIILLDDSDIQTFVEFGNNNGGNIIIIANALVVLGDNVSREGFGGSLNLFLLNSLQ